jgi:hypothetical protein
MEAVVVVVATPAARLWLTFRLQHKVPFFAGKYPFGTPKVTFIRDHPLIYHISGFCYVLYGVLAISWEFGAFIYFILNLVVRGQVCRGLVDDDDHDDEDEGDDGDDDKGEDHGDDDDDDNEGGNSGGGSSAVTPSGSSKYTNGGFSLEWKVTGDQITFTMSARASGMRDMGNGTFGISC